MARTRTALIVSVLLVAAACAGNETATTSSAPPTADSITVSNQGGVLEGHTPTGFAGSGTGLFAGDNLNASFPDGVGVQLFLTFALPLDVGIGDARIVSDALHISGTPFEDLGPLVCDVSTAVEELVGEGSVTAQFRIRFTRPAGGDGQQDLAMFFRRDSNTNESGIFELEITPDI